MTPAHCRVKHDPEAGTYGDCVRACIASLLDVPNPEHVPHFYHDNCDATEGIRRMREYLRSVGYAIFAVAYDGSISRDELMSIMEQNNPDAHYMLLGQTEPGNDHAVICKGGKQVHDPSWIPSSVKLPHSAGIWMIAALVRA